MRSIILFFVFVATVMSQCPGKDEYCGLCAGTTCVVCYNSFSNNITCVAPTKTVTSCANYFSDGVCMQCQDGYYLDGALSCKASTDSACFFYDVLSKCLYCKNGIKPQRRVRQRQLFRPKL